MPSRPTRTLLVPSDSVPVKKWEGRIEDGVDFAQRAGDGTWRDPDGHFTAAPDIPF